MEGTSLPKELGIGDHIQCSGEIWALLSQHPLEVATGSGRNRRLLHHDEWPRGRCGDVPGRFLDCQQIGLAGDTSRRAHADEHRVGVRYSGCGFGREGQATAGQLLLEHHLATRLVERHAAPRQSRHLFRVGVASHDHVTHHSQR